MDDDQDFITVDRAFYHEGKFCVEIRRWNKAADGHIVAKCSQPLSKTAANALAMSWGKALKLEVR